ERRGTKIFAPEGEETRPLRDRIRESVFDMIRADVPGTRVLDAFAGSGAVGLEALSNGATHATFIEPSREAAAVIQRNIEKLRYTDKTELLRGKTPRDVPRGNGPYDLVFLMPPYRTGLCVE